MSVLIPYRWNGLETQSTMDMGSGHSRVSQGDSATVSPLLAHTTILQRDMATSVWTVGDMGTLDMGMHIHIPNYITAQVLYCYGNQVRTRRLGPYCSV